MIGFPALRALTAPAIKQDVRNAMAKDGFLARIQWSNSHKTSSKKDLMALFLTIWGIAPLDRASQETFLRECQDHTIPKKRRNKFHQEHHLKQLHLVKKFANQKDYNSKNPFSNYFFVINAKPKTLSKENVTIVKYAPISISAKSVIPRRQFTVTMSSRRLLL